MDIINELRQRGLVKQVVNEEDLKKEFNSGMVSFYAGFDPTADSLTVGHFLPILFAKRLQMAGHKPYLLIGGGTAQIGDPSGRTDMRKMLTKEQIDHNVECISNQLKQYLSFEGENAAVIVNNADWLENLNYIEFIRDIGSCLSVNKMLTADCFKQRLEKGLSFLEFNYMPMQAFDFLHLRKTYDCMLEVGGDDQWSNMLAGADLVRRKMAKSSYALTIPLLLKSDGTKMGKTAGGALWVDPERTTAYDLFQYFRNVEDEKTEECLRFFTFLSIEEISELVKNDINNAKEVLAYNIVKIIRGEEAAEETLTQVRASFNGDKDNMRVVEISADTNKIIDILTELNLVSSNGEAKRLIQNNGIKIDDEVVSDPYQELSAEIKEKREFVLMKGKKVHLRVKIK